MLILGIERERLIEALRLHRGEIIEADEWRPLADHVLELLDLAAEDCIDLLRPEYPEAVKALTLRVPTSRSVAPRR